LIWINASGSLHSLEDVPDSEEGLSMLSGEVMSREVVTVRQDATLEHAVGLMLDKQFSGLPVVDEAGRLVGVLTEGDLLRRVETGTEAQGGWLANFFSTGAQAERYVQANTRRVADLMTPEVVSVAEDTPLADVVRLMEQHRIKRLLVLRDGRLVGLISRADLVRALRQALLSAAQTADDATIVQRIQEKLRGQPWADPRISIACENGEVVLDGWLFDRRVGAAYRALVESVPGVKRVENRLVYYGSEHDE
jgi:CBS domain-containing protein